MRFLKQLTINLDAVPSYVSMNGDWVLKLDKDICRLILETDDERITPLMKEHFQHTYNLINAGGELKVRMNAPYGLGRRYAEMKKDDHSYWGNLVVHSKYIKNTIFHYLGWRDYDQKKGHPTILAEVGIKLGSRLLSYEEYIADFAGWCEQLIPYYSVEGETPLSQGDIKDLFNKTIYGGGHSNWVKAITWEGLSENELRKLEIKGKKPKEMRNKTQPHPLYERFLNDTKFITRRVYDANPKLVERLCKDLPDDSNDPKFSKRRNRVMSYFCGILENEITYHAYKYGCDNSLCSAKRVDWGYDGFTIPPPPPYTDEAFHLNAMNEYVRQKTGFNMVSFEPKEFKTDTIIQSVIDARRQLVVANPIPPPQVVIPQQAVALAEGEEDASSITSGETTASSIVVEGIIEDDNEGANMIFNYIKDRFKYCYGQFYFKQNQVWVQNKAKVDNHLIDFILRKTDLKKMGGGKAPTPKPYSTNISGARALREALYARLIVEGEDNELLNKFITTTLGKLCFLDGVLDIKYKDEETQKRGKFYKWDENGNLPFEYYTPVQIPRKFAEYFENPDTETVATVKKTIFDNLFGVDCEKALRFFARGVAGEFEDKAWSLYMGNRNCGKGCVDILAGTAIGEYKANVEAQNFLCPANRTLKQDTPERQMAFAMDFALARLVFSQELPPPDKKKSFKMNGDIIKKLMSGGDKQKGKRNYDIFITEFIIMARLIIMCNDCPPFTNEDCLQTCCEFNSTIQFKTKEELDALRAKGTDEIILSKYAEADPTIKTKCRTEAWGNAFVYLMLEYYQDFAVPCIDPVVIPQGGEAQEEDDAEESGGMDLRVFLLEHFIITKSPTDFLKSSAIQEVFHTKYEGDISSKKIGIELKAIGLKNGKKGDRGWFGIQKKPDAEATDDNGDPLPQSNA